MATSAVEGTETRSERRAEGDPPYIAAALTVSPARYADLSCRSSSAMYEGCRAGRRARLERATPAAAPEGRQKD